MMSHIEQLINEDPEYGYRDGLQITWKMGRLDLPSNLSKNLKKVESLLMSNSPEDEIMAEIEIARYNYEKFLHDYHNDMPERMLGQLKQGKKEVDLCHKFSLKVDRSG